MVVLDKRGDMDNESVFLQIQCGDMNLKEFLSWCRVSHTEAFAEGYNEGYNEAEADVLVNYSERDE